MHCLKKTVASPTLPSETDEEYTKLRTNLTRTKADLSIALSMLQKSEKAWMKVLSTAGAFSTAVAKYDGESPTLTKHLGDAAHAMGELGAKASAAGANGLTPPDAPQATLVRRVKTYLSEIAAVEAEYAKVGRSNKEYQLYKKKVTALDKKKDKVGEEKLGRNYQKLERAKADHAGVLDRIKPTMERLWAVRGEMYEALFVSYWLGVDVSLKAAGDGMALPRAFAKERQAGLVAKAAVSSEVVRMHSTDSK